jgi:N-acetylglucosamine-6-phosphate deacetylase
VRRYHLTGCRVLAAGHPPGDLAVQAGRIRRADRPPDRTLDLEGRSVAPGFLDLQINGAFGHDFTSRPEAIWEVGERLPETGVTAFLPTIVSGPAEARAAAQQVVVAGPPPGYRGALPLGLHLEGPMLAPARRGAHHPDHLRSPSLALVAGWAPEKGVALATLAPELPGAIEVINALAGRGVLVSLGHSEAGPEEVSAGLDAGARMGTHLFNAMSSVDHRRPGLATALLARPEVTVGLIADGLHVHPEAVRLAWTAKGCHRLALVTDAMAAMGKGPGTYRLGPVELEVGLGGPRTPGGRPAGSLLSLDEAVRNLVAFTGCEPSQAVVTVTSTPATLLGDRWRGHLRPGARADLVVLEPDLTVAATLVGGEPVYDPKGILAGLEEPG